MQGVFTVASRYDVMNDLMSVGIHRVWKDAMMDWLAPRNGARLLDVAGVIGRHCVRAFKRALAGRPRYVTSPRRCWRPGGSAEAEHLSDRLEWLVGDAMALPFATTALTFIRSALAFGMSPASKMRSVRPTALKPGAAHGAGVQPNPKRWAAVMKDRYSYNVIPAMGQVVTGDRDSYQYLVESIRKFPQQDVFARMISDAGFGQVKYRNLTMGIAALHSGWKL